MRGTLESEAQIRSDTPGSCVGGSVCDRARRRGTPRNETRVCLPRRHHPSRITKRLDELRSGTSGQRVARVSQIWTSVPETCRVHSGGGTVGPWTVDGLVSDVHRHASAGRWLWATTAICLLQELLFCIDDGGVDMSRHLSDFTDEVRTLRTCARDRAHREDAREGRRESADEFCFRMERDSEFWMFAPELLDNWPSDRPDLARTGIRCIGSPCTASCGWSRSPV